MVRKYPKLDRVVGGYGRLKYYMKTPPKVNYQKEYDRTIGFLIRLVEHNNGDLDNLFNDTKGIMKIVYEFFGFTRLTHYILYTFNQEKEQYYSQIKYQ